jgi:hypothetical protein
MRRGSAGRVEAPTHLQVNLHSNFGFALLNVLTLGIWSPAYVEYRCAKEPLVEEHLGNPGGGDAS